MSSSFSWRTARSRARFASWNGFARWWPALRRRRARRSDPKRRPRAPLRKAVRQGPASRGGARLRSRAPWPGDQRPELARRYLGTVQIALHDLHPERRECLLLFDRFDGIRDDARAGLLRLVDDGDDRLRVRDVVA